MMSLKRRIRVEFNRAKETVGQPDFPVYTEGRVGIGSSWNRTGKTTGNPYISLTAALEFGPHKIYPNLGRATGQDDDVVMAFLWRPN